MAVLATVMWGYCVLLLYSCPRPCGILSERWHEAWITPMLCMYYSGAWRYKCFLLIVGRQYSRDLGYGWWWGRLHRECERPVGQIITIFNELDIVHNNWQNTIQGSLSRSLPSNVRMWLYIRLPNSRSCIARIEVARCLTVLRKSQYTPG